MGKWKERSRGEGRSRDVRKEGRNDDGEGERYSALGRGGIREGTVDIMAVASWDLEAEEI
jgi:hypothetical protein